VLAHVEMAKNQIFKLNLKSTFPKKFLCDEKIELEGLREKPSSLEEFCNLLNNEKNDVVSQLESVEAKLGNLERRFTKLEEIYVDMEKDKES